MAVAWTGWNEFVSLGSKRNLELDPLVWHQVGYRQCCALLVRLLVEVGNRCGVGGGWLVPHRLFLGGVESILA